MESNLITRLNRDLDAYDNREVRIVANEAVKRIETVLGWKRLQAAFGPKDKRLPAAYDEIRLHGKWLYNCFVNNETVENLVDDDVSVAARYVRELLDTTAVGTEGREQAQALKVLFQVAFGNSLSNLYASRVGVRSAL